MTEVFVGLGANLGSPADNLRMAVERLRDAIRIHAISALYRSEPVGLSDQPDFLNAVLKGSSDLRPPELLELFLSIERSLGRVRDVPMGPRTLDLDLLLYGDAVVDEPGISVPHPRMAERRFVLEPLAEIAPDVVHPVLGRTASELLDRLRPAELVERIEWEGWPPTG